MTTPALEVLKTLQKNKDKTVKEQQEVVKKTFKKQAEKQRELRKRRKQKKKQDEVKDLPPQKGGPIVDTQEYPEPKSKQVEVKETVVETTQETGKRVELSPWEGEKDGERVFLEQKGVEPLGEQQYVTYTPTAYMQYIDKLYVGMGEQQEELRERELSLIWARGRIDYDATYDNPDTPEVEAYSGKEVYSMYTDAIQKTRRARSDIDKTKSELTENLPEWYPYMEIKREVTSTGEYGDFVFVTDPEKKADYEYERMPLISKIGATTISAILYVPEAVKDVAIGTSVDIWTGYTGKGVQKSIEQTGRKFKIFQAGLWEKRMQHDYGGLFIDFMTSPTAMTAWFTAGGVVAGKVGGWAFKKGKDVVSSIVSQGKTTFGKFVPETVKKFPSKFADVKLAKQSWKGFSKIGEPSYITPELRGHFYMGRYIEPSFYQPALSGYERWLYKPIYGTPSRYDVFQEELAFSNLKKFKNTLMKDLQYQGLTKPVKTKTTVIGIKESPQFRIVSRKVIGKDIYTKGQIDLATQTETGVMYYKLSPKDVFYQTKGYRAKAGKIDYIGQEYVEGVGYVQKYESMGGVVPRSEIKTQLFGYRGQDIRTGVFKTSADDLVNVGLYKSTSLQKVIGQGEKYITKKGFFAEYPIDITLTTTKGKVITGYSSKGTLPSVRTFRDTSISYLKSGESGGVGDMFAGSGDKTIVKLVDDLFTSGGIGVQIEQFQFPSLLPPMQPFMSTGRTSLSFLDWLDEGIIPSSFWGTLGKPAQTVFNIGLSSMGVQSASFKLNKQILDSGKKLKYIQVSQFKINPLQASVVSSIQKSVPVSVQSSDVSTTQQQQQQTVQQQQTELITGVETPTQQTPTVLLPTVPISQGEFVGTNFESRLLSQEQKIQPPIRIPMMLPDRDGEEPVGAKTEKGYIVYVKSRQYVHGKPQGSEKFRVLTKTPLSYDDAYSLLGSALDNTVAQTGYIKPANKPAKELKRSVPSRWGSIQHKFEKKKDKVVEARPFAIDTVGEKQELNAFEWLRKLPKKKQEKKIQRMKGMDMYGFDKMNDDFAKILWKVRF